MVDSKKKVFVAMSGGVDSSVAALLLQRQGYEVIGAHMVCWEGCDSNEDRRDAMRVAAKLGIPFLILDFRKEYREKVFDYMVQGYAVGRTPNPDVMCNKEIKFGIFLDKALELGADYIATGHYVRLEVAKLPFGSLATKLYEAKDKNKDQSYFLWAIPRERLQHCLFPVGDYLKSQVRAMALEAGLLVAAKPDSQGLCFVGKVDFQDFLRGILPSEEGRIVNSAGEVLGTHDGAHFFTAGQRHGLNLGGFPEPLYVAEKDVSTNTLVVAQGERDPILYRNEIEVSNLNLISDLPERVEIRIRYRQPKQKARIVEAKPPSGGLASKLIFSAPQRGVAPGQSAVFYHGEELLGGGIIV